MSRHTPSATRQNRRGTVLIVIVVIMAMLALVVVGSVRPVRDEADLATLRVESTRAFFASQSGVFITISAVRGYSAMPAEGSSLELSGQTIHFVQVPDDDPVAILEGVSGDATRRIELTTE